MKNSYVELKPSVLKLPYDEWTKVVGGELGTNISPKDKGWFKAWGDLDFVLSPMDDNIRMHMRYAHFLGYWDIGVYEEIDERMLDMPLIFSKGTGVR